MTVLQLGALLVRLFALWLAVKTVLEVPIILNFLSSEKDATFRLFSLAFTILSLGFCMWLWKHPLWVTQKIMPKSDEEGEQSISANDFLSAGILLIGIWTVFEALPPLVRQYIWANSDEYADMVLGIDFYSHIYALAFKVVIGIWLILGAPGFRKMLNWLRTVGVRY